MKEATVTRVIMGSMAVAILGMASAFASGVNGRISDLEDHVNMAHHTGSEVSLRLVWEELRLLRTAIEELP